jgi:hypothetical protein
MSVAGSDRTVQSNVTSYLASDVTSHTASGLNGSDNAEDDDYKDLGEHLEGGNENDLFDIRDLFIHLNRDSRPGHVQPKGAAGSAVAGSSAASTHQTDTTSFDKRQLDFFSENTFLAFPSSFMWRLPTGATLVSLLAWDRRGAVDKGKLRLDLNIRRALHDIALLSHSFMMTQNLESIYVCVCVCVCV